MVKAEFPIGKTQWRKWGDEAREAYNRMRRLGFTHETGVAEGNAVQAKVRAGALQEVADLGQEMEAMMAAPVEVTQTEKTETVQPVQPVKKPTARTKKSTANKKVN